MSAPLAYLLSWTTKGSWLHGDPRGWVRQGIPVIQEPDPELYQSALTALNGPAVVLNPEQRTIVARTIEAHCQFRKWNLHAFNPRTNHVHVVVTANDASPEDVMEQFKAWCSRRLNEAFAVKKKWWTEHGSTKWINDETYLHNAIVYVRDRQ